MAAYLRVNAFLGDDVADASALVTIFALVSHAPILAAAMLNQQRGAVFLAVACWAELVLSLVYHACRGSLYCFGFSEYGTRFNDHIGALSLVGALALHLLQYDPPHSDVGAWARYTLPFVVLVAVQAWPLQLQSAMLLMGFLLVVAAWRYLRDGALAAPRRERFVLKWVLLGVLALVLASLCYLYDSGTRDGSAASDGAVHSVWHLLAGLALLALSAAILDDDEAARRIAAADARALAAVEAACAAAAAP